MKVIEYLPQYSWPHQDQPRIGFLTPAKMMERKDTIVTLHIEVQIDGLEFHAQEKVSKDQFFDAECRAAIRTAMVNGIANRFAIEIEKELQAQDVKRMMQSEGNFK